MHTSVLHDAILHKMSSKSEEKNCRNGGGLKDVRNVVAHYYILSVTRIRATKSPHGCSKIKDIQKHNKLRHFRAHVHLYVAKKKKRCHQSLKKAKRSLWHL